jgi:acyl-CoA reductase-like NAD-dependent aldehyde dehydrogenase
MNSIVGRIIGIAVCGVIGALVAWVFVGWIALDGVLGALAAAGMGMVVATAGFVGWTTLARSLERQK